MYLLFLLIFLEQIISRFYTKLNWSVFFFSLFWETGKICPACSFSLRGISVQSRKRKKSLHIYLKWNTERLQFLQNRLNVSKIPKGERSVSWVNKAALPAAEPQVMSLRVSTKPKLCQCLQSWKHQWHGLRRARKMLKNIKQSAGNGPLTVFLTPYGCFLCPNVAFTVCTILSQNEALSSVKCWFCGSLGETNTV